jgi:hypothetical protein
MALNFLRNRDVQLIALGIQTVRATATLPASTLGNIFTVSNGRILVVSLVGEVTTAIQNQACNLSIGTAPTVGTGSATVLATATSIIAAPIGTHFVPAPGSALSLDLATQAGVSMLAAPFIVNPGSITITTSATNTGSVKWDLAWIPLDNSASVVAA